MLTAMQAEQIKDNRSVYHILDMIKQAAMEGFSMIIISESLFNPYKNEELFSKLGYKINYTTETEIHQATVEISW